MKICAFSETIYFSWQNRLQNLKWDNGAERERLLTAAGYDYNAVQKLVNEKLHKKTVDEIANEVIRGEWGNGAERKERLTAGGYDYYTVQARVNELLK